MTGNPISGRIEALAQAIAERVVNLVVEAIDVNALMRRVDVDDIVRRVDVDDIVLRVDVDRIIERVDVDRIIERVDVDALVRRVDVDAIVSELDVDALIRQTELGSIIAKSTSGVMTEVLDVVRAQGVGLDDFCARWVNRLLRRHTRALPIGPPLLVGAGNPSTTMAAPGRADLVGAPPNGDGRPYNGRDDPGDPTSPGNSSIPVTGTPHGQHGHGARSGPANETGAER